jgi:hypothetical protein
MLRSAPIALIAEVFRKRGGLGASVKSKGAARSVTAATQQSLLDCHSISGLGPYRKFVSNSDGDYRVSLQSTYVVVEDCLLRQDITLDGGIGADGAAIRPIRIADVSRQVQRRMRSARKHDSGLEWNAEVLVVRDQAPPTCQSHGGGGAELQRSIPAHRITRSAHIVLVVQRKGIQGRHGSVCLELDPVIKHNSGADVKASPKRIPVQESIDGAQLQTGIVVDPAVAEGHAVAE